MARRALGLLLVTVAAVPWCFAAPDRAADLDSFKSDRGAQISRLVRKGTPDSLAAAALLKQFGEETDTGAYSLVARAVQLAPDRRDLAWLAIRLCASAPDCDPVNPEAHLRDIDPRNAVGFMGDLARSQRKNDVAGVDAALTSIGQSERTYVYYNPLVVATATELLAAGHPVSQTSARIQTSQATVEMIGVIAASVLPPFQSFSLSCKDLALQAEGRLEKCRQAAKVFERADTFLVEGAGLSLQQRLWPLDSAEGKAITARRRTFQYRLEEYSRLDVSSFSLSEVPADLLKTMRGNAREQDTALVYFGRAKVPVEPPEGWTSNTLPRVP